MNCQKFTLGLAGSGAVFRPTSPGLIPPTLLSGLVEVPDNQEDALSLIVIPPGLEMAPSGKKPLAAWLPPDSDGRVHPEQIDLAEKLGCVAIFAGDTAFGTPAIYKIANYPGELASLEVSSKKPFPVGLVGAGFHFGSEPHPLYPWRGEVAEPLLKTFPSLSYLPLTASEVRGYRAKCDLSVLCGGVGERFLPEFLEILVDGSCLVTQSTPVLAKLGFVNDVNCLFIAPNNAVARCAGLLGDPVRLQRIQEQGQKLARKIIATSGAGIVRAWWQAHRTGRKLVSEVGMNHRPRRAWDFFFPPS